MNAPYLEHLNITVLDVDAAIRFLKTAMPEFEIRGGGTGEKCKRWVHIGTEDSYLAIEDRGAQEPGPHQPYIHPGMNHIGFVTDDLDAVAGRLREAGYREGMSAMEHPHRRRIYFFDDDGNEYEFVEYLSTSPSERNDYNIE